MFDEGDRRLRVSGIFGYGQIPPAKDSRGLWQTGKAVFMRNWSYAYALGNTRDSPIKGKFEVSTLPTGAPDGDSAAALGVASQDLGLLARMAADDPTAATNPIQVGIPEMHQLYERAISGQL